MKIIHLIEGAEPKLPGAPSGIQIMTPQQFVAKNDPKSQEDVAEVTGDKPFDKMMQGINTGTAKQAAADRQEIQRQSQERARNAFGPSPAASLSIRKKPNVAEDQLNEFLPALAAGAGALARGAAVGAKAIGGAALKGAQVARNAVVKGAQAVTPGVVKAGQAIRKVPGQVEKGLITGFEVIDALVPGGIFNPDGSIKGSQYLTKYLTPQQIQQAKQQSAQRPLSGQPVAQNQQQGVAEGVAESNLNEYRDQLWTWVQSKFPRTQWPEYVQRDFLYAKAKGNKNRKDLEDFLDEIQRDFGNCKWTLTKIPITLDIFTPKTQRMIQSREGGSSNPFQVPKDAERHAQQSQMIQQKGVSAEPIIVAKLANGYDLIEGWHRTIQHLKAFPQGYTGPAWVCTGATYKSESVEQGVAEGDEKQLSVQQLATISDEALDQAYGYGRSTPGNSFGWQANLMSAAYAKKMIDAGVTDIEKISDAIHKGWNVTAQKFVQNPDQFGDTEKLRQAGKLEGKLQQRAQLMKQNYAQLPNDEQEKDRVVARALLQALKGSQDIAESEEHLNRIRKLSGLEEATKIPAQSREFGGQEFQDYMNRIVGTPDIDKKTGEVKKQKDRVTKKGEVVPGKDKYISGKTKSDKYTLPYIHRNSAVQYLGPDGQTYSEEKIIAALNQRPKSLLKQNEKMRHSNGEQEQFFNIGFAALTGIAVDEQTGKLIIVNTCPGAGSCKVDCFIIQQGGRIQFEGPWLNDGRILTYLLNDPDGFFNQLSSEISKEEALGKKGGYNVTIRWHDSGDFFSPEYLEMAFKLAAKHPNNKFYAYTKMAGAALGAKPPNFIINWSEGAHTSQEKQVKAQDPTLSSTKNSRIVPEEVFQDLLAKNEKKNLIKGSSGQWQLQPGKLSELKNRLAKEYGLSANSILSYDEYMTKRNKIPSGMKYNVIVMGGEGDVSANDPGVLSTLLLKH